MTLIWTVPEQPPRIKMRLAESATVSKCELLKPPYVGVTADVVHLFYLSEVEKYKNNTQHPTNKHTTQRSGGVLGANFMQGHDILFDWENNRVGFAPSNCNYDDVANEVVVSERSEAKRSEAKRIEAKRTERAFGRREY